MNNRWRTIAKAKRMVKRAEMKKKALLNAPKFIVGSLSILPAISFLSSVPRHKQEAILSTIPKIKHLWRKIRERRQELA